MNFNCTVFVVVRNIKQFKLLFTLTNAFGFVSSVESNELTCSTVVC